MVVGARQRRGAAVALGAEAFWPAFVVVALVTLSSIIPLTRLMPDAGDELSGRQATTAEPAAAARDR